MRLAVSLLRGEETLSHARWQITGSFYLFHLEDPSVLTLPSALSWSFRVLREIPLSCSRRL